MCRNVVKNNTIILLASNMNILVQWQEKGRQSGGTDAGPGLKSLLENGQHRKFNHG